MIDWLLRWKNTNTPMSERRTLMSRCAQYKIEESNIRYGRTYKRNGDYNGIPIVYRAMVLMRWGWWIISSHRRKSAAIKAVEYYAENGHIQPPKKKRRKKVKVCKSEI